MRISKSALVVMGFLLVGLCVSPALADIISFDISVPNAALSGFTGPYATVDINRTSTTTATITFTSLTNGGFLYMMGDGGSADLNVNGTYTLGTVTLGSISGFTPVFISNTPGNVDGFGNFNLSLNLFDGFTDAATSISFGLTDISGTWATAADVLTANSHGASAAIHAFAAASTPGIPVSPTQGAAISGFAADAGTSIPEVPEPATLLLLGSGLLGLVALPKKFKK